MPRAALRRAPPHSSKQHRPGGRPPQRRDSLPLALEELVPRQCQEHNRHDTEEGRPDEPAPGMRREDGTDGPRQGETPAPTSDGEGSANHRHKADGRADETEDVWTGEGTGCGRKTDELASPVPDDEGAADDAQRAGSPRSPSARGSHHGHLARRSLNASS